ncbi:glycosyltransferase [Helicobacter sp. T3_23-1059]
MTSKKQSSQIHCAILTSFGGKAGGGHLHRVQKIKTMLQKYLASCDKNVDFVMLNSEEKGQKKWTSLSEFRAIIAKYAFIIIDSYELKSKHFKALLKRQNANKVLILDDRARFLDFAYKRFAKKMCAKNPQKIVDFTNALRGIFVLNSGLSSENLLRDFENKLAKKTAKKINNLRTKKCAINATPNRLDFGLDFAILSDFLTNNVFYGSKFFIKNADFDFAKNKTKKRLIKPHIKDMLITFGACDKQNYTQQISNMLHKIISQDKNLASILDSSICLHIILGGFYPHIFKPKSSMAKSNPKSSVSNQRIKITYKIYQNIPSKDFARVMRECDIAISAGGQSLYELAQSALPFIIIPTASNQLAQSSAFAKKTGAFLLKTHTNAKNHKIFHQNLAKALSRLSQKKRAKISQNLAKLELGKSASDIAHRFLG